MKVSVNWIRDLNRRYKSSADPMPNGIDDLVEKIGTQLGAVDEVIDLGKKYKGITVVKVVSCEKHPNADKLTFCLIDDGGVNKKVKRNKEKLIQVVCGAPNVKASMLAAWIPPGATVPSTYDKEPFVIEAREIRGQTSNGMLASAKELALSDNHEGILEVDPESRIVKTTNEPIEHKDVPSAYKRVDEIKAGDDFMQVYKLDDYIIDIENKMFTHRPDLFGQLGIARELAGIQNHVFVSPPVYKAPKASGKTTKGDLPLKVNNEIPKLVPRFVTQVFTGVSIHPSEIWMQSYLSRVGIKPINNIVDITNYFMMLTGQPLHAYDYNKLKTATIGVRLSKSGEKLKLLGGREIKLNEGAVVITDGQKPIGLGGIMGGAETEVDQNTRNIVLECATFDMNLTRKTAFEYGLFTDAATRFTKKQSPWQNDRVVAWARDEIIHQSGAMPDGAVYDIRTNLPKNSVVKLDASFVNTRLGTNLPAAKIKKILENVEFEVELKGNDLSIQTPFWRTDIEIPEDIVEEVGRLYGYDKLPLELPKRNLEPAEFNKQLEFKSRLSEILTKAGANEVLTYSFVHDDLLQKVGQDKSLAYKITNALSPDLQYYRLSLTPSLLEKVHPNIKLGYREFALFEINKAHNKIMKDDQDKNLPKEFQMLALTFASGIKSLKASGAPFYQARKLLDYLAKELGLELEYKSFDKEENYQVVKPFDHNRSAQVWDKQSKAPLGMIGEYKRSVVQALKLPPYSAGFEIGVEELFKVAQDQADYQPLNRYPSLEQDFNLRTSVKIPYAELNEFMTEQLELASKEHGYNYQLLALDIFQKPNSKDHKQTTWRIILSHPDRTLTTEETNNLLARVAAEAKVKLKAERV